MKIDPKDTSSAANVGTDGTITVYLDPGTYTVTETAVPSHTKKLTEEDNTTNNAEDKSVVLTAGNTSTVSFYNQELLNAVIVKRPVKRMEAPVT